MTEESGVRARKEGAVGWMIFDNPSKLNAVSADMFAEALDVLTGFENDAEVQVVVMRGAGEKAFVSGGDISKFEKSRIGRDLQDVQKAPDDFRDRLDNCAKPVIAMIHGYCLGGGLGIALCADLRFAADTCQIGIPAAQRGIAYAPDGLARLVDVVGSSIAKDMMMSARRLKHEEALRVGLVNRVFSAAELEHETIAYAQTLAANAPLAVRAAKYFINQLRLEKAERNTAQMSRMQQEAAASEDFKEATRAFMEKRKPVFRGR